MPSRGDVIDLMVKATNKFAQEYDYGKVAEDSDDGSKEYEIAKIMANISLDKDSTIKLCSCFEIIMGAEIGGIYKHLTGLRIHGRLRVSYRYTGITVYCTGNDNSHRYPLNVPLVAVYGDVFVSKVTDKFIDGNNLTPTRSFINPATDEQIREFVEGLSATEFTSLAGKLGV